MLDREGDQVEGGVLCLDQVRDRSGADADLTDLVHPMCRQRCHRDEAGLQHPVPGDDGVQPVADLEQHRITRSQAEVRCRPTASWSVRLSSSA